ncbi:MAG TPA: cation diffusion facilitator family transporter [Chitinophagaceae bacterium]
MQKFILDPRKENLQIQKWVVIAAISMFLVKITAYWITSSVAILTDALESTVNVVAGLIGWYSLYISAKPRDKDHPYGHGKAEFISAAVEGTLIVIAGIVIIVEAVDNFIHPHPLLGLDKGALLIAFTAAVNFAIGYISIRKGKKNASPALVASGKHLQSDTWSTIGIIAGLVLIVITGQLWLDSVVATIFALIIIFTGYKIIRSSLAGIMDEADRVLLDKMVSVLNENRRENWIDLHNLRVIKYGGVLHVDCHLTVPWYLNVMEAHVEVDELSRLIRTRFGESLELFVHTDGCLEFSCSHCKKDNCHVRRRPFEKRIPWTPDNVIANKKHSLTDLSPDIV